MAHKVRVLSEDLVNKIAAGEVVERPASVVKELLENAIDAGSSSIWVEVNGAGRELIRVADDGEGMGPEDAVLALQRHSTSKVSSIDDLEAVTTLGFRGEALPSIAAVSHLELTTREATALSGARLVVEGGQIKEVAPVGRPPGTTVSVRYLFYNTPARRKFLKRPGTELRHITRIITALAVAYPEIAFHFIHNGSEIFAFPPVDDLRRRLEDIYGREMLDQAIPLEHSTEGLRVFGWLGRPEGARTSRTYQFTYVNRRPILSQAINHALLEGYGSLLPKDRFPLAVLFLEIDPRRVDVNVHPTKREVRFSAERWVHDAVAGAVGRALRTMGAVPQAAFAPSPFEVEGELKDWKKEPKSLPSIVPPRGEQKAIPWAQGEVGLEEKPWPEKRVSFWQLHGRYILSQIKDGLIIVDQHAAHERVIYEAALGSLSSQPATGQQLLFPLTVELSTEQMGLVEEALSLFHQLGFGIHPFGKNTVLIEAVPTFIQRMNEGKVFREILDELLEGKWVALDFKEKLATSLACKAAIKDGDPLAEEEMEHLINTLFATEQPFFCPHGRPTLIRLSLSELDRRFGR